MTTEQSKSIRSTFSGSYFTHFKPQTRQRQQFGHQSRIENAVNKANETPNGLWKPSIAMIKKLDKALTSACFTQVNASLPSYTPVCHDQAYISLRDYTYIIPTRVAFSCQVNLLVMPNSWVGWLDGSPLHPNSLLSTEQFF